MTESLENSNEGSKSYKKSGQDIFSLKNELNELHKKKEEWFKKKEDLKKELNSLISKIKDSKSSLDRRNSEVSNLKKERDADNKKVRELINTIKRHGRQTDSKEDPAKIKSGIEKLEKKIEFMAIDFSQEKKIMDQLKELQKKYSEAMKSNKAIQDAKRLSDEIDKIKARSNESHKKIQNITKKSDNYREFIALSKKINSVKKEQEDAFENFVNYKNRYLEINNLLKKKLVEKSEFLRVKQEKKIGRKKKEEIDLEEKKRLVEEKVRRGKKLTTEDLMIFQAE